MRQFLFSESQVVVVRSTHDGVLGWRRGLNQHSTASVATSRSTSNLGNQLKSPLGRSQVGLMQKRIGVDDAHQSNVRKIESLGNHLGAQQDLDFSMPEFFQGFIV